MVYKFMYLWFVILQLSIIEVFCRLQDCIELRYQNDKVCKLVTDYNAGIPFYYADRDTPLEVETYMNVLDFVDYDWNLNTITLFIQLWTLWNDTRITISNYDEDDLLSTWTLVPNEIRNDIFFPSISFQNAKTIDRLSLYGARETKYFWIHAPHHLEYREILKLTSFCDFDFNNYPFDFHECDLILGSDVLADFRIQLTEPKILRKEREITAKSQHKLNVPFDTRIESISPFNIPLDGFNYSHVGLKIYLERNSVSLLIGSFYGPTSIFSLLSMFSYCINVDSVPGRMGLIITLYLIAANIYSSLSAPPGRGFSYIELWMVGIQVPILVSLVEYSVILGLRKYWKQQTRESKVFASRESSQNSIPKIPDISFDKVDMITCIVSLIYYFLFCLCYWGALY